MWTVESVTSFLVNLQKIDQEPATGTLEWSSAPKIQTRFGSGSGWTTKRLIFDKLGGGRFKVAVCSGRCFLCCGVYAPARVVIDGHQETVLIHVKSMMKRFDLPKDVILDNLWNLGKIVRIVQEKCLLFAPNEKPSEQTSLLRTRNPFGAMLPLEAIIQIVERERRVFRLSRRCYGLPRSIDILPGGFVAIDTGKCLGNRGYASVKISKTLQGIQIARRKRFFDVYNFKEERIVACFKIFNEFRGKIGILQTLAMGIYENKKGRCQLVSFHPLYDQDFQTFRRTKQPEKDRLKIAHQLLQGLTSIAEKGIHCDLSYQNVFLRTTNQGCEAVIGDLETFRYHEEGISETENPQVGPEKEGMKREVWDLGNILHYILQRDVRALPWDGSKTKEPINQENLDKSIGSGRFSSREEVLLRGMLAIDPSVRWTAKQSLEYFEKYFANHNSSHLRG